MNMALNVDSPQKYREGDDFDMWVDSFEIYLCALGITESKRKRALMLHILGTDIQQRLKDVDAPTETSPADEYEATKLQLRLLLKPQVRMIYERNIFHSMNMMDKNENVRDFVARLKKQADRCDFSRTQRDEMIRDILIARCPHPTLQVRLLESQKLTTEDAIKIWESYLQVRCQSQKLQELNMKEKDPSPETEETEQKQESVNRMREKYRAPTKPYTERNNRHPSMNTQPICSRCGKKVTIHMLAP